MKELLAPNGKKSNLTPEQYKLVRTPAFIAWFGDWEHDPQNASKVIDENGEPLPVWHGTAKEFNIFNKRKIGSNFGVDTKGFFFTSDIKEAEYSAEYMADGNGGIRIMNVFLNIRNPYILNTNGVASIFYDSSSTDFVSIAEENKNDGIIVIGKIGGMLYVVFEPEQIKLADGYNTKFDIRNPDIRFSTGGNLSHKILYHVTDAAKEKIILKQGITPQKKASYTNMFGSDIREHKKSVFAFTNQADAVKWAFKREYDGKEPVIIVVFKAGNIKDWKKDNHIESQFAYGEWLQKEGVVEPSQIIKIVPFKTDFVKKVTSAPYNQQHKVTWKELDVTDNPDIRFALGGIPPRYKEMGFSKVGEKMKSTRTDKKWMVLAKKGKKYKVVHGGYKGMEDYTQHKDKERRKRFWKRMGGFNSAKANDSFSPLYWHKKFGTWEAGGAVLSAPNSETEKQNHMKESEQLNQKIIKLQSVLPTFKGKEKKEMEQYVDDLKFLYQEAVQMESEQQQQTPPAPPPEPTDYYEEQRQKEAEEDAEKTDSGYQKSEPKFRKGQQVEAEGYDQPLIVLAFANKDGEIMLILLTAGGDKVEMSQQSVVVFGIYLGKPSDEEVQQGENDFKVFAFQISSGQGGGESTDLPPEDYTEQPQQQQTETPPEEPKQLPEQGSADVEGFSPEDLGGGFGGFSKGGNTPKFKQGEDITYTAPVDGDEIFDYIKKVDDKYYYISQGWLYKNCEKIKDNLFRIKIADGNKLFKKRSVSKKASGGGVDYEKMENRYATLKEPYRGYRNIQIVRREGLKWLVEILGSGKQIEVYEDEFILD